MKKTLKPSLSSNIFFVAKTINQMKNGKENNSNILNRIKNYNIETKREEPTKVKTKLKSYIPLPTPSIMYKQDIITEKDLLKKIHKRISLSQRGYRKEENKTIDSNSMNSFNNYITIDSGSRNTKRNLSSYEKFLSEKSFNSYVNNSYKYFTNCDEEKEVKKYDESLKKKIDKILNENKEENEIKQAKTLFKRKALKKILKREYLTYNNNNNLNMFNKKFNENNNYNNLKIKNDEIKLEDVLIIEERINMIIEGLKISKKIFDGGVSHECYEYWTFYFQSSLPEHYTKYFDNIHHVIIKSTNNLELFTIILTYVISLESELLKSFKILLCNIFPLIKRNFYFLVKQILNNLFLKNEKNIIFSELLYLRKINQIIEKNLKEELSEEEIVKELVDNSRIIVDYIKIILTQITLEKTNKSLELTTLFNNISKLPNQAINEFFYDKILKIHNINGSMVNIFNLNYINIKNEIKIPYITKPSKKKYTLILDLDETLVCVKYSKKNNKNILYFRPGLYEFLDSMKVFYELISFTSATQNYAEPIIKVIESKKKYFSYYFYRPHNVIIDKEFIKDISRIGRPLNKSIIVDNMGNNFRLNRENGILIYPYYDENNKRDNALIKLKNILLLIYQKNYNDIRDGLKEFKDEIIMNVSCCLN